MKRRKAERFALYFNQFLLLENGFTIIKLIMCISEFTCIDSTIYICTCSELKALLEKFAQFLANLDDLGQFYAILGSFRHFWAILSISAKDEPSCVIAVGKLTFVQ